MLLDWLYYCGEGKSKDLLDDVQNNIEKIGFFNLIQLHFIMGNISQELYTHLKKLNTSRNDLVHGIRDINLDSNKTKDGLEKNIVSGIEIYGELFKLYRKTLDKFGSEFISGESKLV